LPRLPLPRLSGNGGEIRPESPKTIPLQEDWAKAGLSHRDSRHDQELFAGFAEGNSDRGVGCFALWLSMKYCFLIMLFLNQLFYMLDKINRHIFYLFLVIYLYFNLILFQLFILKGWDSA
jgi:hypothetical protein